MTEQFYTLIAFKPHKMFNDRGDDYCLPAKLIREDNLTKNKIFERIKFLASDTPYEDFCYGKEEDIEFNEFHIFPDIDNDFEKSCNLLNNALEEAAKIKIQKRLDLERKWEEERNIKNNKAISEEKELARKLLQKYPELKNG